MNAKRAPRPKVGPTELRSAASLASHVFVIKLEGEFDLADCEQLREVFGMPMTPSVVVLDFEKTSYIDSSVLQCLLELRQKMLEREATLILWNLRPCVKRLFEICQFDRMFDIGPNPGERPVEKMFAGAEIRTLRVQSRIV